MGNTLPISATPTPSPSRAVIIMVPQSFRTYLKEPWRRPVGKLQLVGTRDELPPALNGVVSIETYIEMMSSVDSRASNYRGGTLYSFSLTLFPRIKSIHRLNVCALCSLPSCRGFDNNCSCPVSSMLSGGHNSWVLCLKVPGQWLLPADYPCSLCGGGILCSLLFRTTSPRGRKEIDPGSPRSISSLEARVWDYSQNEEDYWPNCG